MRALSMQALTNDYRVRYPGIVIFGVSDEPHKLRLSDHNEDDTEGSLAAQSDPDTTPEHRAIDVMLGPVFNRIQALASISEILAIPRNRLRLRYINFETTQWHMSTGFQPRPNGNDPHPTHIHFSGLASMDDDVTPWLGVTMLTPQQINVLTADAWRLLTILEYRDSADYQLTGEPTPRSEPNLLKKRLEEIAAMVDRPVTITDEQLERVLRKVLGMTPTT